jgi:hypothetical protein
MFLWLLLPRPSSVLQWNFASPDTRSGKSLPANTLFLNIDIKLSKKKNIYWHFLLKVDLLKLLPCMKHLRAWNHSKGTWSNHVCPWIQFFLSKFRPSFITFLCSCIYLPIKLARASINDFGLNITPTFGSQTESTMICKNHNLFNLVNK